MELFDYIEVNARSGLSTRSRRSNGYVSPELHAQLKANLLRQ
jgi:hypothetical protein